MTKVTSAMVIAACDAYRKWQNRLIYAEAMRRALQAALSASTASPECSPTGHLDEPIPSSNRRAEDRSSAVSQSVSPWRGIESAPRDGTKIDLLYPHPRGRFIDAFLDETLGWVRREPRWGPGSVDPLPEEEWAYRSLPNMLPTHWMPLPSPPREAAGPESLGVPQDEPSPSNPQDQNNINLLVEALRPFAEAICHLHPALPDNGETLDGFKASDFRRAAEALSQVKGGETASRTDSAGEGLRPFASEGLRVLDKLACRDMTDSELVSEAERVGRLWDEMFAPDPESGEEFEGHAGSPGEWMAERLDEVATEQRRRVKSDIHNHSGGES